MWPAMVLMSWSSAWFVYGLMLELQATTTSAWVCAVGIGLAPAIWVDASWRRAILMLGFPISWLVLALMSAELLSLPGWIWLVPLVALLLAYPRRSWQDAPLFPTPVAGLDGLERLVDLPDGAWVLDAGCGLGHGLKALRRAFPQVQLVGLEMSSLLSFVCRFNCPFATIKRGDMWAHSWRSYSVVYMFQRPESMDRAWCKAKAELLPGSWLISLEFPIEHVQPTAFFEGSHGISQVAGGPKGRCAWLYQVH